MPDPGEPPVVLVHGFATSAARTWGDNGWIDLLGDAGREVHALDLLGHGTAPKPHDPAAYDELEDDLLARIPDGPVDAIGFSLGSRTLLALASDHPERFNRLIVSGVGANLFRQDESTLIADAIDGGGSADNPTVRYFQQLADPEALAALMRRSKHVELTAEGLARITGPVLVVLGDKDFAGPADPLMEKLPGAELVTLKGVDHFATPKDFGFIDAALDFLGAGF
jgi:pimeloyl-ACP methyl ester carboxylesterase